MTEQEPDILIYENRTFIIIDVEHGKHPHAEFVVIHADSPNSTANCRGYKAEYSIEDNQLFGRQVPDDDIVSPKTSLHYTGSVLIGRKKDENEFWVTDFLQCYLNADESFELYFEDGVLTETRNLADVLAENGIIKKSVWWTSDIITPAERSTTLDYYCRTHLKYRYGCRTYRWQGSSGYEEDESDWAYLRELEEKQRMQDEDYVWVHKLLAYLPLFREKKGNFLKKIHGDDEAAESEIIDKEAYKKFREFEMLFYNSPLFDNEYPNHTRPLRAYYPKIEEAVLHADRTEICALITSVIRSYHFCANADAYEWDIEDGRYIPLLENLKRIIDETYHPWKKTDLRTGDARFAGMKNWTLDETLPPDEEKSLDKMLTRPRMGKVLRIIDETYIAGRSYVNLNDAEYQRRFFDNIPLLLVPEPENQHDKKAVRVEDSEHVRLGYLPRAVNDIPYRLFCGGYHVYAYPLAIHEIEPKRYSICVVMDIAEKN